MAILAGQIHESSCQNRGQFVLAFESDAELKMIILALGFYNECLELDEDDPATSLGGFLCNSLIDIGGSQDVPKVITIGTP